MSRMEWMRDVSGSVSKGGGVVIGVVVVYRGLKCLVGPANNVKWKWNAVVEYETVDGGMSQREAFGRSPREALARLARKSRDIAI